jgi:hypothetical protein
MAAAWGTLVVVGVFAVSPGGGLGVCTFGFPGDVLFVVGGVVAAATSSAAFGLDVAGVDSAIVGGGDAALGFTGAVFGV